MTEKVEDKLADLDEKEMRALISRRFVEARQNGTFQKIHTVAMILGHDPVALEKPGYTSKYGLKYVFKDGALKIYADDYGRYMTVHWGQKQVCSTHQTERFIIPGYWLQEVDKHYEKAVKILKDERKKSQEERRKKLQEKLI